MKIGIMEKINMKPITENKIIKNPIVIEMLTDAYKQCHWKQYPMGTTGNYAYLESRGGENPYTVFFGLQYIMERYLEGSVVTNEAIDEAIKECEEIFGFKYFNEDGWRYIANELGGKLPLEIKAVPEGTPIPVHNILMSVRNTDPKCHFLPGFFEGLLEQIWYSTTVATRSRAIKVDIEGFAQKAGEHVSIVHLNDFGFRGASSSETAGIGGMAHLVNFSGSDTLLAKRFANIYYDAEKCTSPVLLSVYAAEHSTVTSYGEANERQAYREILKRAPPEAIVSMVIDSYDAMRAVDEYIGKEMKAEVLARPGKLVFRPDSGDPLWMSVTVLDSLWKNFGGIINPQGYKVLNPHVGMIYGDFISPKMIHDMLIEIVIKRRYAPSNIVFGMGGELLQKVNRDTQSFAYKCSAIEINGTWQDVYKRPVSDSRKVSKRGIMALIKEGDTYKTIPAKDLDPMTGNVDNVLKTVFLNGDIVKRYTFEEVRKNAAI
jgi:nicotinamide phosphoribosyltransferase